MRKIITVVVMAIGLLTMRPTLANEDTTSGSYYLRHGCKPNLTKTLTQLEAFETGWCSGTIYGLHYAADMKTICSPPDVTVAQEVGIVTKYIEDHPETRERPFRLLALAALKEAFPCASNTK
ncbi:Rap1a/Tai family immunity protein [Bradyrhizobium sp. CCGUVB14]|uniref:Rap1a/Tai family immunity protein n=1 Tax=Bradyrhizobium sp. CCGUVB14 TaxID=2949628 RepID=UPI0020B2F317|nr:Rap1a/Tai family immunity protein [Bradyrhizobium sp. CCGUVB14]MCP3444586.1 hypothetical protein [Bradyrhizobium sp. CCGUVB14]